ncbi:hypothetical protein ES703_80777 [subsurface metagenome]
MVNKLGDAETTPGAQAAPIHQVFFIAADTHDSAVVQSKIYATAHGTVGANGLHLLLGPPEVLLYQGTHGADGNALPIGLTAFIKHRRSVEAARGEVDSIGTYDFTANPDTFAAQNAFIGVKDKERIAGVYGQGLGAFSQALRLELNPRVCRHPLQLAVAVLGTCSAVGALNGNE